MTQVKLTAEQIAELKQLRASLPMARKRAAEAARTYGRPLDNKSSDKAALEAANVKKIETKIAALTGLLPETKPEPDAG